MWNTGACWCAVAVQRGRISVLRPGQESTSSIQNHPSTATQLEFLYSCHVIAICVVNAQCIRQTIDLTLATNTAYQHSQASCPRPWVWRRNTFPWPVTDALAVPDKQHFGSKTDCSYTSGRLVIALLKRFDSDACSAPNASIQHHTMHIKGGFLFACSSSSQGFAASHPSSDFNLKFLKFKHHSTTDLSISQSASFLSLCVQVF